MMGLTIRAVVLIAAVYSHFLIFAQFSFIELVRSSGMSLYEEKWVLGLMALGGILGGFVGVKLGARAWSIRYAFGLSGLCALLATVSCSSVLFYLIAISCGVSLGVTTVSLATQIGKWCRPIHVGIGTGLAYACCNVPWVFSAKATEQAWIAVLLAVVGMVVVPSDSDRMSKHANLVKRPTLGWVIAVMTLLVWLDSAAFFVIQHTPEMVQATWCGDASLWRNALVHFMFACLAGIWIQGGMWRWVNGFAWLLLSLAAIAVNEESWRHLAGYLYPAGVSLYSTVLVVWASWRREGEEDRVVAMRAAWLFGIAGWLGSANGIGMAQKLNRVPLEFLWVSGFVVFCGLICSGKVAWRTVMVVMAMGVVLGLGWKKAKQEGGLQPDDAVVRGRAVYVSEGCIHCHSQYVRPGSVDEQMWGPANAKVHVLSQQPVLIGNRRQGPDLSHVGIRRSALWLKAHFMDPQQLVPDSVMPSYGYLFRDQRGDDLVSYLKSLGSQEQTVQVWHQALKWEMDRSYLDNEAEGKALYERQCAVCHGAQGDGGGALAAEFVKRPTNLRDGPFGWTVNRGSEKLTRDAVSRVIKYGLPGTDMPGHETLQDRQISALTDWILKLREKPAER